MLSVHPSRAWYSSSIDAFRAAATDETLGAIARNSGFAVLLTQRDAWIAEIKFLRDRFPPAAAQAAAFCYLS